jgi:hypothetical protein
MNYAEVILPFDITFIIIISVIIISVIVIFDETAIL